MSINLNELLPSQKIPKNFRVGFELWEILTLLTVILSLASSVMWFSNLQPKKVESQFMYAEVKKHVFYNQFQLLNNVAAIPVEFSKNTSLTKTCYSEVSSFSLDTNQYDVSLSKLSSLESEYESESSQVKSNLGDILSISGFDILLDVYTHQLSQTRENLQNQYALEKYKLQVLQGVSKLCLSPLSEINNFVSKIEIDLDVLSDSRITEWKNTVKSFLSKAKNISEELAIKPLETTPVKEIGELFVKTFSTAPSAIDSYALDSGQEKEIQASFDKIELWQKNFIKDNRKFVEKVVFIKG